jgi:hypothetical protein
MAESVYTTQRPRLCLATSYDARFVDIGSYCAIGLHLYAARWKCAVHIDTDIKLERPPAWHRVHLIPQLFDAGYEYVLWTDADSLFVRFDVDVLAEIRPDKDLYIVEHPNPDYPNFKVPNTGVMLVRNSPWSRALFEQIWSMKQYENHPWWENAALIDLFGYRNLLGKGAYDPNHELLKKVQFLDQSWNQLSHLSGNGVPVIRHYAGISNTVRRAEMPKDAAISCRNAFGNRHVESEIDNRSLQAKLAHIEQSHAAVLKSLSWRVTAPLRLLHRLSKR